jgi:hypothetical protein
MFQRHFVNHKSHIGWTATELGPPWWEAASALARLQLYLRKTHSVHVDVCDIATHGFS